MIFRKRIEAAAELTEKRLSEITADRSPSSAKALTDAMEYSLLGGGKRLRAYLALEFCELCGGKRENALDYASALEMIHAFSLIHDDLPSMDNDDMRRGKPSCHKAFGEATALLAGDSLALDAFGVVCRNALCSSRQNERAAMLLSACSGSKGMCSGQQYDLDGEGKQLDISALETLVDLKTGALFSCACMLGCIAAGASEPEINAASRFGMFCGRAFQITDDLLDISSTPEELGKSVGKDIEQQKSTFVSLLGADNAEEYAKKCINEAKGLIERFENSEAKQSITEFCEYILTRKN